MDFRLWRDDKKQKIKDIKKLWGRHLNVYAKILMLVEQQGDHECMSPRDIERVLTVLEEIKKRTELYSENIVHSSKKIIKNVFASVVCPPDLLQSHDVEEVYGRERFFCFVLSSRLAAFP